MKIRVVRVSDVRRKKGRGRRLGQPQTRESKNRWLRLGSGGRHCRCFNIPASGPAAWSRDRPGSDSAMAERLLVLAHLQGNERFVGRLTIGTSFATSTATALAIPVCIHRPYLQVARHKIACVHPRRSVPRLGRLEVVAAPLKAARIDFFPVLRPGRAFLVPMPKADAMHEADDRNPQDGAGLIQF
jgi:hypothetical protein